ncbi:MAG: hypothetical protein D6710_01875 [Nitrospirae bacterium]|nr:MAG: hypothetical protein D6710_01875 [Nitrospirota bacterium]
MPLNRPAISKRPSVPNILGGTSRSDRNKVAEEGTFAVLGRNPKSRSAYEKRFSQPAPVGGRKKKNEHILRKFVRGFGSASSFKNPPDFSSTFTLSLFASPVGRDRVVYDCRVDLTPPREKYFRLSVYLVQDGKTFLLDQTALRSGCTSRIVSGSRSIEGLKVGKKASVVGVVDDGEQILGAKKTRFTVVDPGASPVNSSYILKTRTSGRKDQSAVSALVVPDDVKELLIGPDQTAVRLIATLKSSVTTALDVAAYTTSNIHTVYHSISFMDLDAVTYKAGAYLGTIITRNTGKLETDGAYLPSNNYSCAVFRRIRPSDLTNGVSGKLLITVNSTDSSRRSNPKLYLGNDMELQKMSIDAVTDNGDGTYDITLTTPYCNTDMVLYPAPAANIAPSDATVTEFTTALDGTATVTMTLTTPSYIGVAVAKPSTASLYERTDNWYFIDE